MPGRPNARPQANDMQKIIAIVNHKGGVGKSTTTHNLGKALALAGHRVLIIDNDPQANLTTATGTPPPARSIYSALCEDQPLPIVPVGEGLDLVPSELEYTKAEYKLQADIKGYFKLRKALEKLDGYAYVLIDCPPSLGILTLNALIAAHSVLVVVQSSFLSAKGLQTILDVVKDIRDDLNPRLQVEGFLLTQANNTVIRRDIAEWVRDHYQGKVFQTVVRQNVALEEATARGQDIFQYNPHANGAEDYRNLAKELMG